MPNAGADLGAVVSQLLPSVGGDVVRVEATECRVSTGPLTLRTAGQQTDRHLMCVFRGK